LDEAGHKDNVDDEELDAVLTTHLVDHCHERTEPWCTSIATMQHHYAEKKNKTA